MYTFFAANKIGVGVVALNVRYREAELEYMLNNSSAKGLISLPSFGDFNYIEFFKRKRNAFPRLEKLIFIGNASNKLSFDELINDADTELVEEAEREVSGKDTSVIIYTSGTTGKPKGANITHKSILSSSKALAEHMRCSENDVLI